MKMLKLDNLGFNSTVSDLDSNSLGPAIFSYAKNFRCYDDKVLSYNGSTILSSIPTGFNAGFIHTIQSNGVTYYIVLGRSKCKVYSAGNWYDISPSALALGVNQELDWTATMLGNIPVFNNPYYGPVYWSPQSTAQILLPLLFDNSPSQTWIDKGFFAKTIRAHKNFLFALNLTEGGTSYPYSYRWSHPADTNGLPPSWDDTDLAFIASKESIAGSGNDIIDGCSIRDAFCIYSKGAVTILDYVGDEFVWHARQLSSSFGLATENAVVEFMGVNAFLTDGDILLNDGNSLRSVLNKRLRRKLASSISSTNYANSFAIHVPNMGEVWFCIVEEGSTYASIAYIYNYVNDTVALRELSGVSSLSYGPPATANDTWDSGDSATWDANNQIWNISDSSPFGFKVVGVNPTDSAIYNLDSNNGEYSTVLERTNFTFEGLSGAATILALYPKIISAGSVKIEIGSQQHYDGPVSWKQAIAFNPNTARRVALRSTGKLHAWRISSIGSTGFTMSGMDIEYTPAGLR